MVRSRRWEDSPGHELQAAGAAVLGSTAAALPPGVHCHIIENGSQYEENPRQTRNAVATALSCDVFGTRAPEEQQERRS